MRRTFLALFALVLAGAAFLLLRGPSLREALQCAGIASLPVGARDIRVAGESAGFGKCYTVTFSAQPEALKTWMTRNGARQTPECNSGQLQLSPAQGGEGTIARSFLSVDPSLTRGVLFIQLSL
ncbi:hypothetical protein DYH09_28850 [bacterium CPR1]|nr:hypothetical protein [bacterium CPR1]